MKTLKHGEQVKIAGAIWVDHITVGTVEGCTKERKGDVTEALQRAKTNGHEIAWTNKSGYCLTADYAGKAEKIAKDKEAFELATMLEAGEEVEIEGRKYTVKINGLKYCDPISFVPVK